MSTTVAAGSSSDHTILAGRTGVFTTTGEGLVRIKSGALGSGFETRRVTTAGETLIGPFDRDVVVTIISTSGTTTGKGRRIAPAYVYDDDGAQSLGEPVPGGFQSIATGTGVLSAVTYDVSNRCTSYTLNSTTYTLTGWGTSTVTVTGSDGSTRTITLDGSGRISGVA